jgi:hypothetical protein
MDENRQRSVPYDARPACRVCGSTSLPTVLSLGELPLANALLDARGLQRADILYPITVVRCSDCGLTQLKEDIPRETLFSEYNYFSSCSRTLVESARRLAERTIREQNLGSETLVLEIASNDGYLLRHYAASGVPVLGVEPAHNIAEYARNHGVETVCDFFGLDLARRLKNRGVTPRVIHAHNVLAHVSDLRGVLEGVRLLMGFDSQFIVKVAYLRDLVENLEFDTIYHEHNFYFTLAPLARLLGSLGMRLVRVEHAELHGGSLRMWIVRDDAPAEAEPSVAAMLDLEQTDGVNEPEFYAAFGQRVSQLKARVRATIDRARQEGLSLAGYGAAAKATQLLNYFCLGSDCIPFVCDISPHKQGHWIPGVRIPVVSPQALLDRQPDLVLLLAWNFADEILEQQAEFRRRGGRFLIPLPEPRIV